MIDVNSVFEVLSLARRTKSEAKKSVKYGVDLIEVNADGLITHTVDLPPLTPDAFVFWVK